MDFETIRLLEEAAIEASRKGITLEIRYEGIHIRFRKLIGGYMFADNEVVPYYAVKGLKDRVQAMRTEPYEDK